ncbi:MAG: leucine-rich repeat protein [Clostridia bacterium]|nr:leucine-rich repeat protein [Clostridia bacterium]
MNSRIKKTLLFMFCVCMFTVLTVFSVSAKTVTKDKLVYEVSKKTATLVECKSNAKTIKVPSKVGKYKVTAIGAWAFSERKKLESVTLPSTVTSIGKAAFNECTSLKKIVIPSSVKKIGSSAFWYCTKLEKAVIPSSVTEFGKKVFRGCNKLTAYVVKGSAGEKYVKKLDYVTLAYRYMTKLTLDAESLMLTKGDTYKLTAVKKPAKLYNSKVSFSSDNTDVATVSSKGVITAVSSGKAVITCKAKDGSGKKAVCTVTVKAKKAAKAVSVAPSAPSDVTGLKVTAVTDNSISLSWNKVSDASGYKVYLYNSASKTYTYKFAVAGNSAQIKVLSPNTSYSFSVKAYKKNDYSSTDSRSYAVAVTGKTLPGQVSMITADKENIYPDKMTLSWDRVAGADGYNLYIYSKTKKDYVLYKSTAELTCQVSGLEAGTTYFFRIRTYSGSNKAESAPCKTFSFTTEHLPSTAQQAVQEAILAVGNTKKLNGNVLLAPYIFVKDFECDSEEAQVVADYLASESKPVYTFTQGVAENSKGETVTVADIFTPFGKDGTLIYPYVEKDSVSFSQRGSGYDVSFDISEDKSEIAAHPVNIDPLKNDVDGFVLRSFSTEQASVEAKVVGGIIESLIVEVPVTMSFYLNGEKHEISFTVLQRYGVFLQK